MLFIVGGVVVLAAIVIIPKYWVPGEVDAAHLGWMSDQWLNEYRASRST